MRILTVSDLHQRRSLYEQLAAAIAAHRPNMICIVGDWLDVSGGDMSLSEATEFLYEATSECEVAFVPGNHEFDIDAIEFRKTWRAILGVV